MYGTVDSRSVNETSSATNRYLPTLFPAGSRHYDRPNCHYDRPNPNYDRNSLLRRVEGGFGVFSRDAFSCKKILGGRKLAFNTKLNESVDYIMLLKIVGSPKYGEKVNRLYEEA